jgi:hypothetical protein
MTMKMRQPAISTCLLALCLGPACAQGTGGDAGAFGNTVGTPNGGVDTEDPGDGGAGDAKPEDDGPASGPVDNGDDGDTGPAADGGGVAGDCCTGHGGMGCADAGVAACVCAQDPFCCDNAWDGACADLVNSLGCGSCAGGDDGGSDGPAATGGGGDGGGATDGGGGGDGDGGANVGDCCAANNSVGCDDPGVEACVCAVDSYCCDTDWDSICVGLVDDEGCGVCNPAGDTGGGGGTTGGGGGGTGDCCAANGSPGCDDAAVEACVCVADAFCCNSEWDQLCVDQVDSLMCGSCGGGGGSTGGGGGPAACCVPTVTAGCPADPALEACVCGSDPFCCDSEWDSLCVDEVDSFMCGVC